MFLCFHPALRNVTHLGKLFQMGRYHKGYFTDVAILGLLCVGLALQYAGTQLRIFEDRHASDVPRFKEYIACKNNFRLKNRKKYYRTSQCFVNDDDDYK